MTVCGVSSREIRRDYARRSWGNPRLCCTETGAGYTHCTTHIVNFSFERTERICRGSQAVVRRLETDDWSHYRKEKVKNGHPKTTEVGCIKAYPGSPNPRYAHASIVVGISGWRRVLEEMLAAQRRSNSLKWQWNLGEIEAIR